MHEPKTVKYTILNGPNKADLIFSIFDRKVVNFTVSPHIKSSLIHEERIEGIISSVERYRSNYTWFLAIEKPNGEFIHGYYDSRTRHGWFTEEYRKK